MPRLAARVELLPGEHAPHEARQVVRELLEEWGMLPWIVDDAVLLISEMVTNAFIHARSACVIDLELSPAGTLRLAVTDRSPRPPVPRTADTSDERGRGLEIVASLADRWGVDQLSGGKQVWSEMDTRASRRYAGASSR